MRVNPFKSIYEICNKGDSQWKLKNLAEFPSHIDIEMTNKCNFKCLMCPTGNMSQKRTQGFMTDEVFEKVLREVSFYKTPLRFIRWGEPLLHPKIIAYIQLAKQAGLLCHLNTNGSLLSEKMIEDLLDVRLDSLKISFQGVDQKSFFEMRNIDFFDKLHEKIKLFYEKRGDRLLPFFHVSSSVTYETEDQISCFKERLRKYTDLVTVGKTILDHVDIYKIRLSQEEKETMKGLKKKQSAVREHRECPEVFDKLSINWDGKVAACCFDSDNKMIVGDLEKDSIKEIWHSAKMGEYRKVLAAMKHDQIELCKHCYKIAP